MAKNRTLDKILEQAVATSFKDGRLQTKKIGDFLQSFKKLPVSEAIRTLSVYKKGLERELDRRTMTVESSVSLSADQIDKIRKSMNSKFDILHSTFLINPSLLGGLRVKIGDTVLDYSVKNSINQLREKIANG